MEVNSMLPLNCSLDDIIYSTVDGNYTYVAFASDDSGTSYSTNYSDGTHFYQAIKTSETEIGSPVVGDFAGLWVPLKEYTYRAWASNVTGTANFSTTYSVGLHTYEAVITSDVVLGPAEADFTGAEWTPIQKTYTYVAYADDINGVNFTTTYSDDKLYFGILVTDTEDRSLQASNFTGLWQPISRKNSVFDYNEFSTMDNISMEGTGNAFGANHLGPLGVHYKGTYNRIYFTWFNKYTDFAGQDKGEVSGHWIAYVDCDTGVVGPQIELPYNHGAPYAVTWGDTATDTHTLPAINISSDGYIIVVFEQLYAGDNTNAHNTPLDIYRSNSPETIEDPSSPGNEYFTLVSTIAGPHSYPHIYKTSNDDMFIFSRSNISTHKWLTGVKSIDNGANWTNLQETTPDTYTNIIDYDRVGGSTDWFLYSYMVEGDKSFGINLVFQANEYTGTTSDDGTTTNSNMKTMYFLHSDDGVTWENANSYMSTGSGEFSKNIITEGTIKYSDMDTYCEVDDLSTVANDGYHYQWGAVDNVTGLPYILYGTITRGDTTNYSNEIEKLYLAIFNTSTGNWDKTDYLYLKDIGTEATDNVIPYVGSISYFRAYTNSMWELILNRIVPDTRFVTQHTSTSTVGDLYAGAMVRITDKTTSFTDFSVGDVAYVYWNSGTASFRIGPTGSTSGAEDIVLDANNKVEIVTQENIVLRTEDSGSTWTLVKSFPNPENYSFANSRFTTGFGDVTDYHLIIQYQSKLSGLTVDSVGSGKLNLILGKRI